MPNRIPIVLWCLATLATAEPSTLAGQAVIFDFEKDEPGKLPAGFSTALTGRGRPGVWVVQRADLAPSGSQVLAQTDTDRTDYRFPVCVYDGARMADATLSVRFKPVSGKEDQAGGIVWRYQDENNYYLVRANAREDNVVLYKVKAGRRTDLPLIGKGRTYGVKVRVASGIWHTLGVTAKGAHFTVRFDGAQLFEVEDTTFRSPGRVGLWTKADSYSLFDDFTFQSMDAT